MELARWGAIGKITTERRGGDLMIAGQWIPSQMSREDRQRVAEYLREVATRMDADEFENGRGFWDHFPLCRSVSG